MERLGCSSSQEHCNPFDRLPDELVLRILAEAARDANDPSGYRVLEGFALVEELCHLRIVCTRFDRIIPQAQKITWRIDEAAKQRSGKLRFVVESQRLKSLRLVNIDADADLLPQASLLAIAAAAPTLNYLEIDGGEFWEEEFETEQTQAEQLFRSLALCPQLKAVVLDSHSTYLIKPLSSRYLLRSLMSLDLTGATLTDSTPASIIKVCPRLESLNLDKVYELEKVTIESNSLKRLFVEAAAKDIATFVVKATSLTFLEARRINQLQVDAPSLNSLKARAVQQLSVAAPKLAKLVLRNVEDVAVTRPWQISDLEVEAVAWEHFMQICQLCNEATVVRIKQSFVEEHVSGHVRLSDFVRVSDTLRNLRNLEVLEIPSSLMNNIVQEQNAFPLCLDFPSLRSLTMGLVYLSVFEQNSQLDLCMQFVEACPVLENLTISIPDKIEKEAHIVLKRFLNLQKSHPHINIEVASEYY